MTSINKYLSIGSRIVSIRNAYHLKQAKFAETIGLSRPAISAIENGFTKPSMPILLAIEYKYGYRWEWVLTGDGEMRRDPLSAPMPFTGYETSDRILRGWINRLIQIFEDGDEKKIEAIKSSLRALDPGRKKS